MKKQSTVRFAWMIAVLLLVATIPAIAQEAETQSADTQRQEGEVFTNKNLRQRLETAESPQLVFTNDDLEPLESDESAEEAEGEASDDAEGEEAEPAPEPAPAPAPPPTPGVFTNADLQADEPIGDTETEEPAPVEPAPAPGVFTNDDLEPIVSDDPQDVEEEEAVEGEGEGEGETEAEAAPAEPAAAAAAAADSPMTVGERAERIAEIDAQLKRLEKRLLAIRNPLLAGTVPSTQEEIEAEAGLDNEQRAKLTEDKIAELRKTLDELRTQ
jgi:hypothetical protein